MTTEFKELGLLGSAGGIDEEDVAVAAAVGAAVEAPDVADIPGVDDSTVSEE